MALREHFPKIFVGVVGAIGVATYMGTRPPKPVGTPSANPLKTPGVANIEGAYQKGGATSTHTKAYGGTTLGQKDDVMKENSATARPKGMDFEGAGDEQRRHGSEKGKPGEAFTGMNYGTSKGK
ncbi:uncharacterized protein AB675_472 [Cyphellophora attinorum]|uniref:Uncharacterized protein n=1 Tax=Cyphellophora attinorum TaxID=1664694 RepID=A0A0N1P3P2_9EURO|nr:uncharacterized protein AB675_472 [Phialophora attinorum]KPI45765.1 hypothetical protein AB675_472 [Phialophora attinorum]